NSAFAQTLRTSKRRGGRNRIRDYFEDETPAAFGGREHDVQSSPAAAEVGEGQVGDDALALYLRQMGAIPMLNRKQEPELAVRLEAARKRYRHAALWNW